MDVFLISIIKRCQIHLFLYKYLCEINYYYLNVLFNQHLTLYHLSIIITLREVPYSVAIVLLCYFYLYSV